MGASKKQSAAGAALHAYHFRQTVLAYRGLLILSAEDTRARTCILTLTYSHKCTCRAVLLLMNIFSFGVALQMLMQATPSDEQHE